MMIAEPAFRLAYRKGESACPWLDLITLPDYCTFYGRAQVPHLFQWPKSLSRIWNPILQYIQSCAPTTVPGVNLDYLVRSFTTCNKFSCQNWHQTTLGQRPVPTGSATANACSCRKGQHLVTNRRRNNAVNGVTVVQLYFSVTKGICCITLAGRSL